MKRYCIFLVCIILWRCILISEAAKISQATTLVEYEKNYSVSSNAQAWVQTTTIVLTATKMPSITATGLCTYTSTIVPTSTNTPDFLSKNKTNTEPDCTNQKESLQYGGWAIASGVMFLIFGICLTTVGFMYYTVTCIVTAILLAILSTYTILKSFEPVEGYSVASGINPYFLVSLGISVLLVLVFIFAAWKYLRHILCVMCGYLLVIYVVCWSEHFLHSTVLLRSLCGAAVSILLLSCLLKLEFITVIFSISFIGAYVLILGVDIFVKSGFFVGLENILDLNPQYTDNNTVVAPSSNIYSTSSLGPDNYLTLHPYKMNQNIYIMQSAVIGACIVSCLFQMFLNRGARFGLRLVKNTVNESLEEKMKK